MKTYIKKKAGPNQAGPGYRTPDHFKGSLVARTSRFSGSKTPAPQLKFNPAQFKTQHKG